jgi:hypothetical protein
MKEKARVQPTPGAIHPPATHEWLTKITFIYIITDDILQYIQRKSFFFHTQVTVVNESPAGQQWLIESLRK